jgi:hypothetical protein
LITILLFQHWRHVWLFLISLMSDSDQIRKFGKQIQRHQLDLPEYAASFLNYKALKKVRNS